jgi:hypothetical protein
MADYPPQKVKIQTEQVQTRKPVSELLMQGYAGSINFIFANYFPYVKFAINGNYFLQAGKNGIDGLLYLPFKGEIIDAVIYNGNAGSSGTTELDCKLSTDHGATWSSIFSTTPKIDHTASSFAYGGTGSSVTGVTAPVISGAPVPFVIGNAIRMDIITAMQGTPNQAGLIIYFQPRN